MTLNSEIQFKPVTSGLGFQNCSDKLHYSSFNETSPSTKNSGITSQLAEKSPSIQKSNYLIHRILAYFVDMAVLLITWFLFLGISVTMQWISIDIFFSPSGLVSQLGLLLFFQWFYVMLQEVIFSTTLGKYFFGLYLPTLRMKIFLRSILFLFGVFFFCVGLLTAVFDKNKRCMHDILTRVQPHL